MFKTSGMCLNLIYKVDNSYVSLKRALKTRAKPKIDPNIRPIISCKRKEYDFYPETTPHIKNKLDPIVLASKGWHNKLSRGDFFIIHTHNDTEMIDTTTTYTDLGINQTLINNLTLENIKHPSQIQKQAIPVLLSGRNALIAAETGCGKTLSYLLPALDQIIQSKKRKQATTFNSPLCLILTPARELAYQIESVARSVIKDIDITTDVIVGGGTKRKMLNPSFKETDLLVATLGAISKLTTTGIFKMNQVQHVVLDEADTLLDESFSEKLAHFLKKFPFQYQSNGTGAQLTLCSATLLSTLPDILSDIIVPDSLELITTGRAHHLLNVPQRFLRLNKSMRPSQLLQLVKKDAAKNNPVIIFSNTSQTCDWVSLFLNENGVKCTNLNGDMTLNLRKNKFLDFQNDAVNVLSCTDVGSRGLDTTKVKHVLNFDFPKYTADYIHRCGRIGRIGSPDNCHVTNFVCSYQEIEMTQQIEMAVRTNRILPKVNGNISGIIKNNIQRQMRQDI